MLTSYIMSAYNPSDQMLDLSTWRKRLSFLVLLDSCDDLHSKLSQRNTVISDKWKIYNHSSSLHAWNLLVMIQNWTSNNKLKQALKSDRYDYDEDNECNIHVCVQKLHVHLLQRNLFRWNSYKKTIAHTCSNSVKLYYTEQVMIIVQCGN